MPLLKDIKSQMPQAVCEVTADGGVNRHLLINRDAPPFDNPEVRRAMALALDRQAFIDILTEGQGDIGGVLQPPPGGVWGMPPEHDENIARVWSRRREEPRRGPQDHGEARLRAG